jgi:hypothetical protein
MAVLRSVDKENEKGKTKNLGMLVFQPLSFFLFPFSFTSYANHKSGRRSCVRFFR